MNVTKPSNTSDVKGVKGEMVHPEKDMEMGQLVSNEVCASNIGKGESRADHHDDCVAGLTAVVTVLRVNIEKSSVIGHGSDCVELGLVERILILVEEGNLIFMGIEDGTEDLTVVLENGNTSCAVLLRKLEFDEELA